MCDFKVFNFKKNVSGNNVKMINFYKDFKNVFMK